MLCIPALSPGEFRLIYMKNTRYPRGQRVWRKNFRAERLGAAWRGATAGGCRVLGSHLLAAVWVSDNGIVSADVPPLWAPPGAYDPVLLPLSLSCPPPLPGAGDISAPPPPPPAASLGSLSGAAGGSLLSPHSLPTTHHFYLKHLQSLAVAVPCYGDVLWGMRGRGGGKWGSSGEAAKNTQQSPISSESP